MHLMNQLTKLNKKNLIPVYIPNLPKAPVRLVITAGEVIELKTSLNNLSIEVLNCQNNPFLENSLASHADMLIHHLSNNVILLDTEQTFLFNNLTKLDFNVKFISSRIKSPYPSDAYLNAARLGHYLICNIKTTAPEILSAAEEMKLDIIAVKQGYTKCSICVLNENTIITDDTGIKNACTAKGIDVLLISKGCIRLRGYHYGFIGGCTGLIDKNKLAFCGDFRNHKDSKQIDLFLAQHNIEPISLYAGDLLDIGGILPILQENEFVC